MVPFRALLVYKSQVVGCPLTSGLTYNLSLQVVTMLIGKTQ